VAYVGRQATAEAVAAALAGSVRLADTA